MNKEKVKGFTASFAMAVIIGLQFIFIKQSMEGFKEQLLLFLFVRFSVALTALLLFYLLRRFVFLKKTEKLNLKPLTDKKVILLCLIAPAANILTQTFGVKFTDVTTLAYLTAAGPFVALFVNWLVTKKKIGKKQFIFIAICVAGALYANYGRNAEGENSFLLWGILLTVAALIFRSLYASISQQFKDKPEAFSMTLCQLVFGWIFFLLLCFFSGEISGVGKAFKLFLENIGGFLYISVMSLTVLYYLNNISLKKISAVAIGVMNNLTFIITLIASAVVSNEKITLNAYIGSALIIIGIILSAKASEEK